MNIILPVEDGDVLGAVRGLLRRLMESGAVEAVYAPLEGHAGSIVPALVTDPRHLERADPLAPVMPINGARAVSALTGKRSPSRLGAVLRPCEIRALVELVKLQQAALEGVTLIGLDCPGTFEYSDYMRRARDGRPAAAEAIRAANEAREPAIDDLPLRDACRMCVHPIPEGAGIHLHLFGADLTEGIPVTMKDEIAEKLGLRAGPDSAAAGGTSSVEALIGSRSQVRERELAAVRAGMASDGGIAGSFAGCVRCHNCMTACPVCYCKTCLFKSPSFDHAPDHFFRAARRRGALRLLGDTLLFHMTRMNHMAASCVNCGMCTSACPSGIPVGTIFSAVASQVQAAFDYVPGRDVNEPLPLIAFEKDEWTGVGEEK